MNGYVSKRNSVSLNDECSLIGITYITDEIGQQVGQETVMDVYCGRISVTASEFYNAGQQGMKPELVLCVYSEEYGQQQEISFEHKRYSLIRTFERDDGLIELYCKSHGGKYGG